MSNEQLIIIPDTDERQISKALWQLLNVPKGSENLWAHPEGGHRNYKEGEVTHILKTFYHNQEKHVPDQEPDIEISRLYSMRIGPNGANMFYTDPSNLYSIRTSERVGGFCEGELKELIHVMQENTLANRLNRVKSNITDLLTRAAVSYPLI